MMMMMMRAAPCAALAIFLALTAAHAQQPQNDAPTNTPVTTLIPGADEASLAGSARASKLIGSNVYQGDTSIGTIEDVLVDLDHGALRAFVLSVGGFLGIAAHKELPLVFGDPRCFVRQQDPTGFKNTPFAPRRGLASRDGVFGRSS